MQRTPLATEAIYLLARYVFDDARLSALRMEMQRANAASQGAAERFGFTFEGVFRQHMIGKGVNRDTAWFSMLDSEWPQRKAAFEEWLAPENFDADGRQKESLTRVQIINGITGETHMAGRLTGKVAFVTAAGQGIGRAIAETFAAEGANVIATDLDEKKLSGLNVAKKASLDVRSTAAVDALAKDVEKEFGPIDILANCAGFVHHGTVLECSEQDWDFSFDLNVKSMHRTIHAFLPGMLNKRPRLDRQYRLRRLLRPRHPKPLCLWREQSRGHRADQSRGRRLHQEGHPLERHRPGTIESPSLDDRIATLAKSTGQSEQTVRQAFVDRQAMGRLGTAQEIANLALFLASDEASYVTGQVHLVDGGFAL